MKSFKRLVLTPKERVSFLQAQKKRPVRRKPALWLRTLLTVLLVTSGAVVAGAGAAQADDGGYPYADATMTSSGTWGYAECKGYCGSFEYVGNTKYYYMSERGYAIRNCTDYVAWKLQSLGVSSAKLNGLGNGGSWAANAAGRAGVSVGTTPIVGSAAVEVGNPGHVAYVEAVNTNGTITVSEYNWMVGSTLDGAFHRRTATPSSMGLTKYIDFGIDGAGSSNAANLHISTVGTDGKVYELDQTSPGTWSPNWNTINATSVQNTSITTTPDGRQHIAAVGGDGNVYIADQQSNMHWGGWSQVQAQVTQVAIAATSPDGKLHIATIGTNGKVYVLDQTSANGAWSSNWTEIMAGGLTSISMATSPLNGKLHIAVTGNDGNVYIVDQSATTGQWGGWSQVQAQVTQVAIAATSPDGKLHIATRGTDGKVYVLDEVNTGGPWSSSWTVINATNVTSVSMVATSNNGKLHIAALGGDANVYIVDQSATTGQWGGWSQVQAQVTQVAIAAA